MTDAGLQLRFAQPEDLQEVGRLLPELAGPLFPERFPGRTVAQFCHWKYFTNPVGDAVVAVAVDGKRVVSLVAAVPKRVRVAETAQVGFELGDFITAPEYRKRGLFSSLIEMTCDEAAKRGGAFVYVRPNESSYRLLAPRLGFREVQKIDGRRYVVPSRAISRKTGLPAGLVRATGIDWITGRLALPSGGGAVGVEPVTRFDKEIDELWEHSGNRFSFSVVKDSQYLNWRYIDSPTPFQIWMARRTKRAAGYIAAFFSPSERTAYLADLFTDPTDEPAAGALLRTAMDAMFRQGARVVYTWTLQSGGESAGTLFLRRVCRWADKQHLHVALRFLGEQVEATLPSSGWQLAMGDFDGI